jgi:acyl-coenzyme A synthetase/AMP-(fatty) acid ligase
VKTSAAVCILSDDDFAVKAVTLAEASNVSAFKFLHLSEVRQQEQIVTGSLPYETLECHATKQEDCASFYLHISGSTGNPKIITLVSLRFS